ncbi:MAG: hypothetical protein HC892_07165 [Saprospiraceae bacterium]|nr:hypothetical protein [Saprospiraceae bacterium]
MLQIFRSLVVVFAFIGSLFFENLHAQCIENTVIGTDEGSPSVILTCPGDGRNDLVTFTSNAGDTPYMYVITNTNNIIVDFQTLPYIDFERARI